MQISWQQLQSLKKQDPQLFQKQRLIRNEQRRMYNSQKINLAIQQKAQYKRRRQKVQNLKRNNPKEYQRLVKRKAELKIQLRYLQSKRIKKSPNLQKQKINNLKIKQNYQSLDDLEPQKIITRSKRNQNNKNQQNNQENHASQLANIFLKRNKIESEWSSRPLSSSEFIESQGNHCNQQESFQSNSQGDSYEIQPNQEQNQKCKKLQHKIQIKNNEDHNYNDISSESWAGSEPDVIISQESENEQILDQVDQEILKQLQNQIDSCDSNLSQHSNN